MVRPHGLKGEVVVELVTNRTERLAPGTVLASDRGDLRAYLLALSPKGQESFRGVLKRDRVIRRSLPADTLDNAAWPEVVDALML